MPKDILIHEGHPYMRIDRANKHDTLRAHYDAAYLAALTGFCADCNVQHPTRDADSIALESVRTHAARMAELDRVIAEVAG